jgi:hypothetical protein
MFTSYSGNNTSGNLGIGTASPQVRLVVADGPQTSSGTLSNNSTLDIYGVAATSRTDNATVDMLRLHRAVTSGNKGSTFAVGLSYYSDPGSNLPRTRVDFKTTTPTADDSDATKTVMSLVDTGNVGIGTVSPSNKLEVVGSNAVRIHDGTDQGSIFFRGDRDDVYIKESNYQLLFGAPNGMLFELDTNNNDGDVFNVMHRGSSRMYIDGATGNVGIGTTNPLYKLQVQDRIHIEDSTSLQPKISFSENTNNSGEFVLEYNGVGGGTGNYVAFYSEVSGWVGKGNGLNYIPSNGRVGIGTTSPDALLHVKAGTNITGAIEVQGGKATVTSVGEINSELNFGSNDSSATGGIGGSIKSVTEATNGANVGMSFYTAKQSRTPVVEEAMRITNSGNVGIGTTSPDAKLEIEGDATGDNTPQLIVASGGVDHNAIIHFTDDEGGQVNAIGALEGNVLTLASLNKLVFKTNTSSILGNADTKMTILPTGNVGIGTITPNALLHVGGSSTLPSGYTGIKSILEGGTFFNIKTEDDKTFAIWNEAVGEAILEINTNENYFLLDPSANVDLKVGIGTASPSETLDVTGNVKADSYINQRVAWNTSFTHTSNSTSSFYYIPTNNTQERNVNLYWNNWIAQYGGRVKKVIMRNTGSSTVPTATTIRYKVTVNGTDVFTSAVLSITGTGNDKKSSYTFTDTDATFNEGDRVQVSFNTNGNLYYTAVGISLEYTE